MKSRTALALFALIASAAFAAAADSPEPASADVVHLEPLTVTASRLPSLPETVAADLAAARAELTAQVRQDADQRVAAQLAQSVAVGLTAPANLPAIASLEIAQPAPGPSAHRA